MDAHTKAKLLNKAELRSHVNRWIMASERAKYDPDLAKWGIVGPWYDIITGKTDAPKGWEYERENALHKSELLLTYLIPFMIGSREGIDDELFAWWKKHGESESDLGAKEIPGGAACKIDTWALANAADSLVNGYAWMQGIRCNDDLKHMLANRILDRLGRDIEDFTANVRDRMHAEKKGGIFARNSYVRAQDILDRLGQMFFQVEEAHRDLERLTEDGEHKELIVSLIQQRLASAYIGPYFWDDDPTGIVPDGTIHVPNIFFQLIREGGAEDYTPLNKMQPFMPFPAAWPGLWKKDMSAAEIDEKDYNPRGANVEDYWHVTRDTEAATCPVHKTETGYRIECANAEYRLEGKDAGPITIAVTAKGAKSSLQIKETAKTDIDAIGIVWASELKIIQSLMNKSK